MLCNQLRCALPDTILHLGFCLTQGKLQLPDRQMCLNPGKDLLFLERLCNVVDTAGIEAFHLTRSLIKRTYENHGNVFKGGVGFQLSAGLESIHVRHDDIEKNQLGHAGCSKFKSLCTAFSLYDLKTAFVQDVPELPAGQR